MGTDGQRRRRAHRLGRHPGRSSQGLTPLQQWDTANVVRGRANGTVSAYAYCRLGDITTDQFRGLAQIQRDFGVEVRITNRQNFALRGLTEEQLPDLHARLAEHRHGRSRRRARPRRRVVPRRRHLQPRGHAVARPRRRHRRRAREGRPRRGRRRAHQHLRLHQLVRPAPHRRHRLPRHRAPCPRSRRSRLPDGARRSRRQHGDRVRQEGHEAPGQAGVGGRRAGGRAVRRRARRGRDLLGRGSTRAGGAAAVGTTLVDLDEFPTPEEAPDYYIDFDETGPYVAEIGDSECAT